MVFKEEIKLTIFKCTIGYITRLVKCTHCTDCHSPFLVMSSLRRTRNGSLVIVVPSPSRRSSRSVALTTYVMLPNLPMKEDGRFGGSVNSMG